MVIAHESLNEPTAEAEVLPLTEPPAIRAGRVAIQGYQGQPEVVSSAKETVNYGKEAFRDKDLLLGQMVREHSADPYVVKGLLQYKTGVTHSHGHTDDSFEMYMRDIKLYRLLAPEEEVTLGHAIDRGIDAQRRLNEKTRARDRGRLTQAVLEGVLARQALFTTNLRLVVSIAKKAYSSSDYPLSDLVQEGNLGLEKATTRFDPNKGFKFSTYATYWIKQSIDRGRSRHRVIHLPSAKYETMVDVMETRALLEMELGRTPTGDELLELLSGMGGEPISPSELSLLLNHGRGVVSFDAPIDNEHRVTSTLHDLYVDPDNPGMGSEMIERFETESEFERLIAAADLSAAERLVLSLRSGVMLVKPDETTFTVHNKLQNSDRTRAVVHPMPEIGAVEAAIARGQNGIVSLPNISKLTGLSQERIERIKRRAMAKLQMAARASQI